MEAEAGEQQERQWCVYVLTLRPSRPRAFFRPTTLHVFQWHIFRRSFKLTDGTMLFCFQW